MAKELLHPQCSHVMWLADAPLLRQNSCLSSISTLAKSHSITPDKPDSIVTGAREEGEQQESRSQLGASAPRGGEGLEEHQAKFWCRSSV